MTLEVYAQAVTPAKRKAQSKVAELFKAGENEDFSYWTLGIFAKPLTY
jgi:hypothetical protein